MPDEGVAFGDQHIGMAVAVKVDELEVRIAHVAVQARSEGTERLPAFGLVMLVQAGGWAVHDDHIGLTVTGQVHELRAPAQHDIGFEGNGFEWGELCLHLFPAVGQPVRDRADISLVEPGAALLSEDAGDAFTVQVCPAIGTAIQADGKVL